MHKVYLYKTSLILVGIAFLTLGIVIVTRREVVLAPLSAIGGTVLLLHGIWYFIELITHGGKLTSSRKRAKLMMALTNTGLGIFALVFPSLSFHLLAIVFGAYILLNAASKLSDFIISVATKEEGGLRDFLAFVFFAVFAFFLLRTSTRTNAFLVLGGVYCILYGAEMISDFIAQIIPRKAKNSFKRRIRISLPVFVSTFMPLGALRRMNEYLAVNNELPEMTEPKEIIEAEPDMEIMVHVSNNGSGKIGHLDLFIDGEIISYGNHDHKSHKLFSVFGDGVMFTADKEPYLDFSVTHDRKIIFSYGLKLSKEQLEAVRNEIKNLKAMTVPWKAPFERAVEENGDSAKLNYYHDYCSILWNGTKARFFKFKKGKFKTYSILSTNCVLLTDTIIGKAGADIVCVNGIASPGIYYDYLEKLYLSGSGMVVSKTIYDRKTMRKLKKERNNNDE